LKHKFGNDAVEGRVGIAKALLTSAKSTEVLNSLRDYVVEKIEVDTAILL
jgi:hypothetical protein